MLVQKDNPERKEYFVQYDQLDNNHIDSYFLYIKLLQLEQLSGSINRKTQLSIAHYFLQMNETLKEEVKNISNSLNMLIIRIRMEPQITT